MSTTNLGYLNINDITNPICPSCHQNDTRPVGTIHSNAAPIQLYICNNCRVSFSGNTPGINNVLDKVKHRRVSFIPTTTDTSAIPSEVSLSYDTTQDIKNMSTSMNNMQMDIRTLNDHLQVLADRLLDITEQNKKLLEDPLIGTKQNIKTFNLK